MTAFGARSSNSARDGYPWPGLSFYTAEEEADRVSVDADLVDRAGAVFARSPDDLAELTWHWHEGQWAVRVMVTRDIERYRAVLRGRLDPERVVVGRAHLSNRDLEALQRRVTGELGELRELGVDVQWVCVGPGRCLEVEYFAVDREGSVRLLRDRFGPALKPLWVAPERLGEEAQPFASWVIDGHALTVFYGLGQNGERPGGCTAEEHPDRVIVRLTIRAPQGIATLIGGFMRSHATVKLSEPLGDRVVIDAASGDARPRWKGPEPA
jgi:hypothetical protein